jgi:hypothetical protein
VTEARKIIIDTDPGVDDAMAIFYALSSPELDVVGLTTIFGNATTETTTYNALALLELAGRTVMAAPGEITFHSADPRDVDCGHLDLMTTHAPHTWPGSCLSTSPSMPRATPWTASTSTTRRRSATC